MKSKIHPHAKAMGLSFGRTVMIVLKKLSQLLKNIEKKMKKCEKELDLIEKEFDNQIREMSKKQNSA